MERSTDIAVGLVAFGLVPLIAYRVIRGLRQGRLPVYRTYLGREESGTRFGALLALHALSGLAMALLGADLIFGLGLRDAL
ncbi:MAG TPA: hypothetical protein VHM92_07865 [Allosphingosinicella sp.]|nr:hypothetical protein [Allosphingosinicella sp.]